MRTLEVTTKGTVPCHLPHYTQPSIGATIALGDGEFGHREETDPSD